MKYFPANRTFMPFFRIRNRSQGWCILIIPPIKVNVEPLSDIEAGITVKLAGSGFLFVPLPLLGLY